MIDVDGTVRLTDHKADAVEAVLDDSRDRFMV